MNNVIGIDEVGRGAWAGPLLIVAARQRTTLPGGLTDSKKTTKLQRTQFKDSLVPVCQFGEGWVTVSEIDAMGLTQAMKLGVARALKMIGALVSDEIIVDGHINYCSDSFINARCIIKADETVPIVSAASIYAKVVRDSYMANLATDFQQYDFLHNVGYGTSKHIQAIKRHGVTEHHRRSYKPIKVLADAAN